MFITSNGTPEDSKECSGRKRYNTVILYGKQKQYCCGYPLMVYRFKLLRLYNFLSFSSFLAVIPCVLMCPRKWPPPRPIVISTSQQGYVVRSYVKEGQKIRKGDRLYELDTSKTTRSGVVSDNEFNEITSQLHGIDEIIRNPKRRDETLQSIKDQRNKYKEAYDISSSIVRTAEQGLQKWKTTWEIMNSTGKMD